MSSLLRVFTLIALVASINGCAGSATVRERGPIETPDRFTILFRSDAIPYNVVVRAPVEVVWETLPTVFRELGYPGAPASKTKDRMFITPTMQIRGRLYDGEINSKYIDCGTNQSVARADSYDVEFAVVTRVRPNSAEETLVEIAIDGNARPRAIRGGAVRCSGTGVLERRIGERLALKLRS